MNRTVFQIFFPEVPPVYIRFYMTYMYLTFIDSNVLFTSQTYFLSNDPVNLLILGIRKCALISETIKIMFMHTLICSIAISSFLRSEVVFRR